MYTICDKNVNETKAEEIEVPLASVIRVFIAMMLTTISSRYSEYVASLNISSDSEYNKATTAAMKLLDKCDWLYKYVVANYKHDDTKHAYMFSILENILLEKCKIMNPSHITSTMDKLVNIVYDEKVEHSVNTCIESVKHEILTNTYCLQK